MEEDRESVLEVLGFGPKSELPSGAHANSRQDTNWANDTPDVDTASADASAADTALSASSPAAKALSSAMMRKGADLVIQAHLFGASPKSKDSRKPISKEGLERMAKPRKKPEEPALEKDCTFKPSIDDNSRKILEASGKSVTGENTEPRFQTLAKSQTPEAKQRLETAKQIKDEAEMAPCTFQPATNWSDPKSKRGEWSKSKSRYAKHVPERYLKAKATKELEFAINSADSEIVVQTALDHAKDVKAAVKQDLIDKAEIKLKSLIAIRELQEAAEGKDVQLFEQALKQAKAAKVEPKRVKEAEILLRNLKASNELAEAASADESALAEAQGAGVEAESIQDDLVKKIAAADAEALKSKEPSPKKAAKKSPRSQGTPTSPGRSLRTPMSPGRSQPDATRWPPGSESPRSPLNAYRNIPDAPGQHRGMATHVARLAAGRDMQETRQSMLLRPVNEANWIEKRATTTPVPFRSHTGVRRVARDTGECEPDPDLDDPVFQDLHRMLQSLQLSGQRSSTA